MQLVYLTLRWKHQGTLKEAIEDARQLEVEIKAKIHPQLINGIEFGRVIKKGSKKNNKLNPF